jgi:predicted DNA binding CopG/RHH family protein
VSHVPKKPISFPKFKTIDEEAEWWGSREGKRVATEAMQHAIATGTAKRRKIALKTVTMRLPEHDLDTAKALAERKGLPYQTYIKMLLHGALEKARRSA